MSPAGRRLLIAGGGTGGHLFPALAIAEAWEADGGEVLFVGTPSGLENRLLPQQGKNLALLRVGRIKGGGLTARLRTLLGLPLALLQAVKILRRFRPHVVLGVGGYASAPALVAAALLRLPTAIHEQNAHAGLANRLLGRLVRRIFLSIDAAAPFFPEKRIEITGNPVRAALRRAADDPALLAGDRPFQLLVFGGSLGARIFAETVPPALKLLKKTGIPFRVQHQVQETDLERVTEFYRNEGIDAETAPFFTDMVNAYHRADLVICRAGATSLAELITLGKPALLIPYPFAADDHQTANAASLVAVGGGWMQRQGTLTPEWLATFLEERIIDPQGLLTAGRQAKSLARPDAARDIVRHLLAMV